MLLAFSSLFGLRSLFLLWFPFIRLSPGFFPLLFILFSFLYSLLLSFAAVALSGHFCFRSSGHIISHWSVFASSSAVVLSLLLGSPFFFLCASPFSAFLCDFLIPFAPFSIFPSSVTVCARVCVVSCDSLFLLPFRLVSLASGFRCLPLSFVCCINLSNGIFCSLLASSSVLSPTSSGGVPWLVGALFQFTILRCWVFFFSYLLQASA